MWSIGIGGSELALVLLLIFGVVFFRGATRRWLGVVLAITTLGVVLTPVDPVSAVLVAAPLSIAFTLGVQTAPFFRQVNDVAKR